MTKTVPRYVSNTSKALEVIVWLAREHDGIDVYHLVKAAFFADKHHVTHYGRPISGDTYEAAPYGPLPQVVYGILRRRPIEMLAIGGNGDLPFDVDARHRVHATRDPNLRRLSGSDVEALRVGLDHVADRTFDEIFEETHDDPAYTRAMGGFMDARDFLPADLPDRESKARDILETADYVAL